MAVRGQEPGSGQLRGQCLGSEWGMTSGRTLLAKVRPMPRFFCTPSWVHMSYFGLEDGAHMSH